MSVLAFSSFLTVCLGSTILFANISWPEQVTPDWRDSYFPNGAAGRDKMENKLTMSASDFRTALLVEFSKWFPLCVLFLFHCMCCQTECNKNDIILAYN